MHQKVRCWDQYKLKRKTLSLRSLAELKAHLQRIEEFNHRVMGQWTAAQNLYHLAAAFEASIEGLPVGYPGPVRLAVRPLRWMITRFRFPPGLPIPQAIRFRLEPPPDADFEEQKVRLLTSIDRFEGFTGQHPPHPVLGPLSREEWVGFHLRHCQHHLAFIAVETY